jgi:hypothetical protein
MSTKENIKVENVKSEVAEGVKIGAYHSEVSTGKKDKMTFALYFSDEKANEDVIDPKTRKVIGTKFVGAKYSYEFEVTKDEAYDIINFADDTLEQAIWGAKINMKKEEIRKWKRLNATNYRAKYPIPTKAMEARFEMGKKMITDFLANNHKKYEDDARIEGELNAGEEFFK